MQSGGIKTAVRTAGDSQGDIACRNGILGHPVVAGHETMIVFVSALAASQTEMGAFQSVGHTSGRDAKRLHDKSPENKGQYESGYQPFEGVRNFGGPVLVFMGLLVETAFIFFIFRHKCRS
jgi:hypothetical protein